MREPLEPTLPQSRAFGVRGALPALAALACIAVLYWPLRHAGFFWIDKIWFIQTSWVHEGTLWPEMIFHPLHDTSAYFRPLVLALFVFESRAFGLDAGPVHLVSIGIHLANTALVGALATRFVQPRAPGSPDVRVIPAMLLFGLHPALIEPVSWIACQFDLLATFFVLAGLLCSAVLRGATSRALGVAACFFLAACSKESALAFPFLLALLDWMKHDPARVRARAYMVRVGGAYVGVIAAGAVYLALRAHFLGEVVNAAAREPMLSLQRVQEVCYLYLTYWRIIIWPMYGLGPVHVLDTGVFEAISPTSVGTDVAAVLVLAGGAYLAYQRRASGYAIVAVTFGLLPVLHLIPVAFDLSLYHERYALIAIAMCCAMLPRVVCDLFASRGGRLIQPATAALGAAWLATAAANVHLTAPFWGDEKMMWSWVLKRDPGSLIAQDHLLSTYLENEDYPAAKALADRLFAQDTRCGNCMLNVANLALLQRDEARAAAALSKAGQSPVVLQQPALLQDYVVAIGRLHELRGEYSDAEESYRDAVRMDPLDPHARAYLALVLLVQDRVEEAESAQAAALSLLPAAEQPAQRRAFAALERARKQQ